MKVNFSMRYNLKRTFIVPTALNVIQQLAIKWM
jgi:hypothetical protein